MENRHQTKAQPATKTPRRARSEEAKQQVRELLIDAGRELIGQEGMAPVSLRKIARHAQYSPALVYRYFPDKAALLMAIRDQALNSYADQIEALMAQEIDAEELLLQVANTGFEFAVEQAHNFGMNILTMLWNLPKNDPSQADSSQNIALGDPSESGARVHELYEQIIIRLFDEIGHTPLSLDMAVAIFMSTITGAVALPAGSKYRKFPSRIDVMLCNLEILISSWKQQGR